MNSDDSSEPQSMRRRRTTTVVAVLVAFLAGIGTGQLLPDGSSPSSEGARREAPVESTVTDATSQPSSPRPEPLATDRSSTTTPPPPDIAATRDEVGPRVARDDVAGGELECGNYEAVRFTSQVILTEEECTYTFVDVEACFGATIGVRTIVVTHSHLTCGWYFESGGHGGVTIEWTLITSECVGLRPQGATDGRAMEVRDSVIAISDQNDPEAHCEALASFTNDGGLTSNVHITRSRLTVESRWTPCGDKMCADYTGIMNIIGTDYVFTDSVFGDAAEPMPAYYMIYEDGATFIRCHFHPGRAAVFYNQPPTPAELVDPVFL